MQLLKSPSEFGENICSLCAKDLKKFAILRVDLRQRQIEVYELAGLSEEHYKRGNFDPIYEVIDETQEEATEYDLEGIEQDDSSIYEEQAVDTDQDMDDDVKSSIKIEKIKERPLDDDEPFGYFEEIIAEESEDQKYMETEYVEQEM